MKLYYHKTDGGAEYYTTKEHDTSTAILRTDGGEIEVFFGNIIKQGLTFLVRR